MVYHHPFRLLSESWAPMASGDHLGDIDSALRNNVRNNVPPDLPLVTADRRRFVQGFNRVWGQEKSNDARRMRTVVKNLRHKLGDNARKSRYIVTAPHVGYRMPKAEAGKPAHA